MTDYRENVLNCGNPAAPGHRYCYSCLNKRAQATEKEEKRIKDLEQKPRDYRDAWEIGKRHK
jgi:hypothetical protein